MSQLTIVTGPPGSGKMRRLLDEYRKALRDLPLGSALWLAPTWRAAAEVRAVLASGPARACLAPGVMTFGTFADKVLESSAAAIRPMTPLMTERLIRGLIDKLQTQGRLRHFGPIAKTAGLVGLVGDFIRELKRLEIWPEHFRDACTARAITDKDLELLEIYEAYQQALRENNLYDAEGRFWSVRDWLSKRFDGGGGRNGERPRFPDQVKFVVVYGFTDLTRTQHEILELLSRRATAIWFSLTLESEPGRESLFARPLKTYEQLRNRYDGARREQLPRPETPDWPALAHVERQLFGNPRCGSTSKDAAGIEILAAARQRGALELVAARVKRLLVEGVARPDEIAIVFRTSQGPDAPIAEVLADYGIPHAVEGGQSLAKSPALKALLALLRLELEDWPADALRAVLRGNYFQPAWETWRGAESVAAAERAIRALRVAGGRTELLEALGNVAQPPSAAVAQPPSTVAAQPPSAVVAQPPSAVVAQPPTAVAVAQSPSTEQAKGKMPDLAAGQTAEGGCATLPDGQTAEGGCSTLLDGQTAEGGCATTISAEGGRATCDEDGEPILGSPERHRLDAAATCAALKRLAVAMDALPRRATLSGWFEAWKTLAQETGLAAVVCRPLGAEGGPPAGTVADDKAWRRLEDAIEENRRLSVWLRESEAELDLAGAVAALGEILSSESVGHGDDESGRVRILSAASARALKIPYLFLAGLAEKSFPMPDREDRLYSEAECQALIKEGLPLAARTDRSRDEMLLFYETIHRAGRKLVFSYPSLDDAGQPLSPSPFLKDVERCFDPPIAREELSDLSPVPRDKDPLNESAHRILAVAQALQGESELLSGVVAAAPAMGARLLAGLEFADARQDRKAFGPTEGVLLGDAARGVVRGIYPAQRTFTATELERYAACPFRFFLERIVKIEPLEELELQIDFLERGSLIHAAMASFHRRVNKAAGRPASPSELPEEDVAALWRETLDEVAPPGDGQSIRSALRAVDRKVLADWTDGYAAQVEKYEKLWKDLDEPMRPEYFEVAFGRGHGEGPPSTAEPFTIVWGNASVKLSGRIDRIDTGAACGKTVFNILDYKTSAGARFDDDALAAGSMLQLPIYALAAAELLLNDRDGMPWQAGYWIISGDGFKARQALKMYHCTPAGKIELDENWEERRAVLEQTVAALVGRLRNAEFPVYNRDEHCTGRCDYRTVCRINAIRSLEKTWAPTPVEHHGD